MKWAEIRIVTTDEAADPVTNILIENGCGGAAITGPSVVASEWAELPSDAPPPEHTTVAGYLPVDDRLEAALHNIRDRFRALPEMGFNIHPGEVIVKPVDETEWNDAWRSFFKTLTVGNVLIKPSWEDTEIPEGVIVVDIDPGMAFGTGNHPTTQLVLLALQKHIKGGETMLDVGTGSGILTIAAAKLGISRILATEIDPVAVESAEKNVAENGVADIVTVVKAETPETGEGEFDIAVANITADPIMGLAPALAKAVRSGGKLVISGIVDQRADEVIACLETHRFSLIERTGDDGWVCAVFAKQ